MAQLVFTVIGDPAPQGSKSAFRNKYTGRIQQVESSAKVKPWRQDVVAAAREEIERSGWVMLDGPVELTVVFYLRRPASAPKRVKLPFRKPDGSKLIRSTEDALTTAGVWSDDARVTDGYWFKRFAPDGWTGARIRVRDLDDVDVVPVRSLLGASRYLTWDEADQLPTEQWDRPIVNVPLP